MENIRSYYYTPTSEEQLGSLYMTWCGYRKCLPTHHIGPRYLPFYKITIVTGGSGFFEVNGKLLSISAGDVFVLFPQVRHHYFANPQNPWELKWVCFNGLICPQLIEQLGVSPQNPVIYAFSTERMEELMNRIIDAMEKHTNLNLEAVGYLHLLLYEMVYANHHTLREKRYNRKEIIHKVIAFVSLNYPNIIDVERICQHVNYSRSYVSHLFKKEMGISLADYVTQVRIENAQRMLLETDSTIQEIASSVGYQNGSYFAKQFKLTTGVTPRMYRQQNGKEDRSSQ